MAEAVGEALDLLLQQVEGDGLEDESDLAASAPVTKSPESMRRLAHWGTDVVEPHVVGQGALGAGRGETDEGVIGGDDHVAEEGDIGAAGPRSSRVSGR